MAHFAKVENGIVTNVIVADQDVIDSGLFGTGWVQTSYNTRAGKHPKNKPLRMNFAGIGSIYDEKLDAFYMPQPFQSWTLDTATCIWEPPVPQPDGRCIWDEATVSWSTLPTKKKDSL